MKTELTKENLHLIEHVSPKVSKRYVPIFTSKIVELLEPEFQFENGTRLKGTETGHIVDLKNGDDTIRIYNSFDRTMALRISLISEGVSIPLGIDRLVHIGAKAANFQEDFDNAKEDILQAVNTAKKLKEHLENTVIREDLAEAITKAVFVHGKGSHRNEGITKIFNYTDELIPQNISVKRYINLSIRSFLQGEYTYIKNDEKVKGTPKRSVVGKLHLENRIVKVLEEQFPEYFL